MHPLHTEALQLVAQIKQSENRLIENLIENQRIGLYKQMHKPSLFVYCTTVLCLTESRSYELISVIRKAGHIPLLRQALKEKKISVSKAARIVSALNSENAAELVPFASTHTVEETADKLSTMGFARAKKLSFSAETLKKIKRVAEVSGLKMDEAVAKACDEFLLRNDKFQKARRAHKRILKKNIALKAEKDANANSEAGATANTNAKTNARANASTKEAVSEMINVSSVPEIRKATLESRVKFRRTAIPAAVSHAVYLRDQGQCAIRDHNGARCPNRSFLETHHIQQVQHGGTNDLENLILICWHHHDMIHQMRFTFADAINWNEVVMRSLSAEARPM